MSFSLLSDRTDQENAVVFYYDIDLAKGYDRSSYIYHGTISCYDTVTTIHVINPYNHCDEMFIYAKVPFTIKETTTALATGFSASRRNPYSFKVILSSIPLKVDQNLIDDLSCMTKETLNDIKLNNAFFIY